MNDATCPGIVVAGLRGDGGKTLVTLGLAAAWARLGLKIAPFKKGPDYIDAAWLSRAAGVTCRNLDSFLMPAREITATWGRYGCQADIALMEGNRGIYDGMDARGSHSTAELAKLVGAKVLLVVDATKTTRTLAALVLGVKTLDPGLQLAGVVLNKVGGRRHQRVATEAIETFADVPVLGAIPRLKDAAELLPGRHLGLVTTEEHPQADKAIEAARQAVQKHLDLRRIMEAAGVRREIVDPEREEAQETLTACLIPYAEAAEEKPKREEKRSETSQNREPDRSPLRIGVVWDRAFPFYYPENLEALEERGAEVVTLSALGSSPLPSDLDALYMGGGFPETHAAELAENRDFLNALKEAAEGGLPIYAECGGLMLLARALTWEGQRHEMAGVLPIEVGWSRKPAGHGYTRGEVVAENPFYEVGTEIRGHEYHHSFIEDDGAPGPASTIELAKGVGVGGGRDGFSTKNVLALYTHVHATGLPSWAEGMVRAAQQYRSRTRGS